MLADQAVHQDVAVAQRRVIDCARRLTAKVWAEPERWTCGSLRTAMLRWRSEFYDGLEHAIAEGWVIEVAEPGQGEPKRLLRPGPVKPS
jgi:hypothetical protein